MKRFFINLKFLWSKGLFDELHYLKETSHHIEDKQIEDYDDLRSSLKKLNLMTENYFSDVWGSIIKKEKDIKKLIDVVYLQDKQIDKLKKQNSTLKSRITRQKNEQNNERKAFLKLMGKTEKDFFKVLK